ncbi:MAG TPA: CusA/CzcA family heavy metal efflux RND transporter [Thermoanaerobaculia bacterium]|nr:CusA/CzcA family heavy metal efflux RND transporter [Thermoanaerobaculia bacterium]
MVRRIVEASLRFPLAVIAAGVALVGLGIWAYANLDIEAYPDPVQPRVETLVQPPGWAAEEVERYATVPLEVALNGMPGLDHIRSISVFGLSDIKCYFHWGTSYVDDRQEVLNRLVTVALPNNLQPVLSPENAIGEIYRYVVTGPYSILEKKTAQDWVLERQFKQVDGVFDVVGFGGLVKQYQVDVDAYRLRGHGLTLPPLVSALSSANQNVGANVLNQGEQSFNVRGIGLIRSLDDIRNVVLAAPHGTPVRVGDVADVQIGHAPRLGIVGQDTDEDIVQGIVIMRLRGNTLQTLKAIKQKVVEIRRDHLLPPGMDLHPYYDRTELIHTTTRTVLHNLVLGMLLVSAVLLLFLGNWRAAAIAAVNIPLALFAALTGMAVGGTPANLISLGAVDFGIIVESTVIMIESCFRHLGRDAAGTRQERILTAAGEVGRPVIFSTIILGIAFLPLFTLTGVTGVIFSPMAHTYAFAIAGAFLLSLTLTPTLASHLPVGLEERDNAFLRWLHSFYVPVTEWTLGRPLLASALGLIPVLLFFALFPFVGREFMPKLEEGNFWIRATLPLSVSLPQASRYVRRMREILRKEPEVETVVSQLGRPDDGTDVSGPSNIELFVPLKPFEKWPRGMNKEKLTKVLSEEFAREFPGIVFNFSQNIQDNVEEALSGVKGENTVKVVGSSLTVDEEKAREIVAVLKTVRGVEDLGLVQTLGQPNLTITPDRATCARYGLNVGEVDSVIQAAVGGQAVTQVFEGEKRFDLVVRWQEPNRDSVRRIQEILVATPDGAQVPLGQIAVFREEEGPASIYREDNHRYVPVKFSVRGRDLKSTLDEAREKIGRSVTLPYDTHLEWAGEINELREAEKRLAVIVPLTLLLIGLLAYGSVRRGPETVIVLLTIPLACSGGLLALLLTGISFSVSAAMGFISIFGIAIQDGILVVSYTQRFWREGAGIEEGIRRGAERGFRPVLMTSLVAMLGLLPAALSDAIGAQTQKPLAVVVIGGALFVAFLTRILRPPMLLLAKRWFAGVERHGAAGAEPMSDLT